MSSLRFNAVEEAFKKKAVAVCAPAKYSSEYYGKYVFNKVAMAKYLSKDTDYYKRTDIYAFGLGTPKFNFVTKSSWTIFWQNQ